MKALVLNVISRSLVGAEDLPPSERADLYDGIAALLAAKELGCAREAAAAEHIAATLREAEGQQLTFAALMRSSSLSTTTAQP